VQSVDECPPPEGFQHAGHLCRLSSGVLRLGLVEERMICPSSDVPARPHALKDLLDDRRLLAALAHVVVGKRPNAMAITSTRALRYCLTGGFLPGDAGARSSHPSHTQGAASPRVDRAPHRAAHEGMETMPPVAGMESVRPPGRRWRPTMFGAHARRGGPHGLCGLFNAALPRGRVHCIRTVL
jgi:hypothetical protein